MPTFKTTSHAKCAVRLRTILRASAAIATTLALTACASVNSTPDAPEILPQERARAAQQHPQILAEFGGVYESPASEYVTRIGNKTAAAAGVPGLCNFTVINTDVVNAFAVPGCYIYITRGLLSVMNSEDELASVLGHEVGHVVADHSDRRQNTAMLGNIGAVLAGVLSGSGEIAQMAGQAAQVYSLSYSRDQEYESDDLGVRYMLANGYNPYAAADMLQALGTASALDAKTKGREGTQQIPEWARTHPLTEGRVQRATQNARASGLTPTAISELETPFLNAINGMIYGDDPEQGMIFGSTFVHPTLKLAFDAPDGFSLTNSPRAVMIQGPNNLRAMFSGGRVPEGGLDAYTQQVLKGMLGETQAQIGRAQKTSIHGFETQMLPARVQDQNGNIVDIAVTAYRFSKDTAYHFVTLAPAGGARPLTPLLKSFRQISDREAAQLKPRRIKLVQVGRRDTIQSLARQMAFEDFQLERFLAINARNANQPLQQGEIVKIVAFGD